VAEAVAADMQVALEVLAAAETEVRVQMVLAELQELLILAAAAAVVVDMTQEEQDFLEALELLFLNILTH
jgi:hypothetical protein